MPNSLQLMSPIIILVNGLPASGKTTIANKISSRYHFPLFSKDELKGILFDTLGDGDRAWSKKIGKAASEIFRFVIEEFVVAEKSVVIENFFYNELIRPFLTELKAKHPFSVVEVYCQCETETALKRFKARVEAGERHPHFHEEKNYPEVEDFYSRGHSPIDLGDHLFKFDTSDAESIPQREKDLFSQIDQVITKPDTSS